MTVKEAIALTFAYYHPDRSLADQVLLMYAADLSDLNPESVIHAYAEYRRDPSNTHFPLPAKIRALVNPAAHISVEDRAAEISARIVGAVAKFGWPNGKDAEAFIGPEGWSIVWRQGGWSLLCESLGTKINITTFTAQVRKLLEANLRHGSDVLAESINASPTRSAGELTGASDVIQKLLEKKPEGAA